MIILVLPSEKYLKSYQEAYDEYVKNNVSTYAFNNPSACDVLAKYERYRNEINLPENRVGQTNYWLVDVERDYFIGEIGIRHKLNDALLKRGGHIGYGVRYSEWNKGYGTRMLKMALEIAKEMNISRVLITCNDDNIASARVMEKNGFVLQDKVLVYSKEDEKEILTRRYWKTIL